MAFICKNKTEQQPFTRRVGVNVNCQSENAAPYYDSSEYSDYYKNSKRGRKTRKNTQYRLHGRSVCIDNIPGLAVLFMAIIAGVCLSLTIVGVGFLIASQPDMPTEMLSRATNSPDRSPFSRNELAKSAVAIKNFSLVDNALDKFFVTLYDINVSCQKESRVKDGGSPYFGEKILEDEFANKDKVQIIEDSINNSSTSEKYLLRGNQINHLNSCYDIAQLAKILITLLSSLALVLLIDCAYLRGARLLGRVLYWSALGSLALFVVLGVLAGINFDAFFSGFHQIFFAQGNWTFSEDSLLICSLPTPFWIGMGVVWLFIEIIICTILMGIGSLLIRRF
ncbi:MAG: DUF1461 domain-containing protein [Eggerthellaceae bacterium]|nr:DUF1461 domain-containing protein [Eggerthellaceae bacterium]